LTYSGKSVKDAVRPRYVNGGEFYGELLMELTDAQISEFYQQGFLFLPEAEAA
jgi:hypothetical protein